MATDNPIFDYTRYCSECHRSVDWQKIYRDHYRSYLGEPASTVSFDGLEVLTFSGLLEHGGFFEGSRVFASLGLARAAATLNAVCELVVAVDGAWDVMPDLLRSAMEQLSKHEQPPLLGTAIRLEDPPAALVREHGKASLYFFAPFPFPAGFGVAHHAAIVVQAFLITDSEHVFLLEHGRDVFESRLQDRDVDLFDLARPSFV